MGLILAKMGRIRKWKRLWENPPERDEGGKVSLSGLRQALVRERRAKSLLNPRPEAQSGEISPVRRWRSGMGF